MATAQWLMASFSFCSTAEPTSKSNKIIHFIFFLMILNASIITATSSLIFGLKYTSIDLGGSIFALMAVASSFVSFYIILNAFIVRHKTTIVFENLSTIFRTSK